MTEENNVSTESQEVVSTDLLSGATAGQATPEVVDAAPTQAEIDDFATSLPEDLRANVAKKGFKSASDVVKAYSELEKLMGRRFEDLTADEISKMNTKLGAPETAEGYGLSLPDGVSDETGLLGEFSNIAHQAGLSKDKAESVFNWYVETQTKAMEQLNIQAEQQAQANIESLKSEFGAAFDERVDLANKALRQYGGDEAIQAIAEAGLSSNPALVKMLAQIGQLTAEDSPVGHNTAKGFGTKSPAEARQEISRLMSDSAFMGRFKNPMDPGHASAQAELESLYKLTKGIK